MVTHLGERHVPMGQPRSHPKGGGQSDPILLESQLMPKPFHLERPDHQTYSCLPSRRSSPHIGTTKLYCLTGTLSKTAARKHGDRVSNLRAVDHCIALISTWPSHTSWGVSVLTVRYTNWRMSRHVWSQVETSRRVAMSTSSYTYRYVVQQQRSRPCSFFTRDDVMCKRGHCCRRVSVCPSVTRRYCA